MTAASSLGAAARGRLFWFGLAALLVVTGVVLGRGATAGPPLSPRSTDPLGTLALVELLEARGHDVDLLDPSEGGQPFAESVESRDVVLVVSDDLDAPTRSELRAWVARGHHAVVFDTSSPLIDVGGELPGATPLRSVTVGECGIDELVDLSTISSGGFVVFDTDGADGRCFSVDDRLAAVARVSVGDGRVTAVGGPSMITNERLADDDNAALVVRLVEAGGGSARVGVVYDPAIVVGGRTLSDLLPGAVTLALWQLLVAAAVLVWWQGRRFGGVVAEPRLVRLPGSLRVRAAAELRRRSGERSAASATLGAAFERDVRRRHRLPSDLSTDQLPAVLATRPGAAAVDATRFAQACGRPAATDDRELVDQLAAIDELSHLLDLRGDDLPTAGLDLTEPDAAEPAPSSTATIEVSR